MGTERKRRVIIQDEDPSVFVEEVRSLFEQATRKGSLLQSDAAEAGLDVAELQDRTANEPDQGVSITRADHGIDPVTSAFLIAFAPVAAKVLDDLWSTIIFPRLKERFRVREEPVD